jgi:hypothetical protein
MRSRTPIRHGLWVALRGVAVAFCGAFLIDLVDWLVPADLPDRAKAPLGALLVMGSLWAVLAWDRTRAVRELTVNLRGWLPSLLGPREAGVAQRRAIADAYIASLAEPVARLRCPHCPRLATSPSELTDHLIVVHGLDIDGDPPGEES